MKAQCSERFQWKHAFSYPFVHAKTYVGLQVLEAPMFYLLVSTEQQMPLHQKYLLVWEMGEELHYSVGSGAQAFIDAQDTCRSTVRASVSMLGTLNGLQSASAICDSLRKSAKDY